MEKSVCCENSQRVRERERENEKVCIRFFGLHVLCISRVCESYARENIVPCTHVPAKFARLEHDVINIKKLSFSSLTFYQVSKR